MKRGVVGGRRAELAADKALRTQLDAVAWAEVGRSRRHRAIPPRWLLDPTWRCLNLHVGKSFGRDWQDRRVCLFDDCGAPVQLTFPEDRTGPLQ